MSDLWAQATISFLEYHLFFPKNKTSMKEIKGYLLNYNEEGKRWKLKRENDKTNQLERWNIISKQ